MWRMRLLSPIGRAGLVISALLLLLVALVLVWSQGSALSQPPSPPIPDAGPAPVEVAATTPPLERDLPLGSAVPLEAQKSNSALAVSVAQPSLTLQGHLESRIRRLPWGDGRDYERLSTTAKSAAGVLGDRRYNPQQKALNQAQLSELSALVEKYSKEYEPLVVQEAQLSRDAMLRAVAVGRFESIEMPTHPGILDPAAANANSQIAKEAVKGLIKRVKERLGLQDSEWKYSVTSSHEPDGISRQNLVYFTRAQEPDFFAARDRSSQFRNSRDADLRAFFDRL